MIQIASFGIDKAGTKEFNEFVAKNPPRSTEKQSGIVFHTEHILVIYDDGRENPDDRKGTLRSLLEGAVNKKLLVDVKIEQAQIAFEDMKPEGYNPDLSDTELQKLIDEQLKESISSKKQRYDTSKSIMNQMANLQNTVMLDSHESRRLNYEIIAYKKLLKNNK